MAWHWQIPVLSRHTREIPLHTLHPSDGRHPWFYQAELRLEEPLVLNKYFNLKYDAFCYLRCTAFNIGGLFCGSFLWWRLVSISIVRQRELCTVTASVVQLTKPSQTSSRAFLAWLNPNLHYTDGIDDWSKTFLSIWFSSGFRVWFYSVRLYLQLLEWMEKFWKKSQLNSINCLSFTLIFQNDQWPFLTKKSKSKIRYLKTIFNIYISDIFVLIFQTAPWLW